MELNFENNPSILLANSLHIKLIANWPPSSVVKTTGLYSRGPGSRIQMGEYDFHCF